MDTQYGIQHTGRPASKRTLANVLSMATDCGLIRFRRPKTDRASFCFIFIPLCRARLGSRINPEAIVTVTVTDRRTHARTHTQHANVGSSASLDSRIPVCLVCCEWPVHLNLDWLHSQSCSCSEINHHHHHGHACMPYSVMIMCLEKTDR